MNKKQLLVSLAALLLPAGAAAQYVIYPFRKNKWQERTR